jgi:hypothetical protein
LAIGKRNVNHVAVLFLNHSAVIGRVGLNGANANVFSALALLTLASATGFELAPCDFA